jgi:hypothetical protein
MAITPVRNIDLHHELPSFAAAAAAAVSISFLAVS